MRINFEIKKIDNILKKIVWIRNDEYVIKMCFFCKLSLDFLVVGVKCYFCRSMVVDYDSIVRNFVGWCGIIIKKWNLFFFFLMVELNILIIFFR